MPDNETNQHCADRANTGGLFFLGLFVAIGLVAAAYIVTGAFERIKAANDTITVKGVAERPLTSDTAVWQGSIQAREATLAQAHAAVSAGAGAVRQWLHERGVPETAISFEPLRVSPQMEYNQRGMPTNRVLGYFLDQPVVVSWKDVAAVAKLAKEASELAAGGVEFIAYQPEFFVADIENVKIQLIEAATANARQRALRFASGGGLSLGGLKNARQGVFQITRPNSVDTSDYGLYDTSTIDKVIRCVVTVTFATLPK